jgi:hypothetical protein
MRTTLTLEPDVEALIRETVYRTGKSVKQAVNDALRTGLATKQDRAAAPVAFNFPSYPMGKPIVDLTKALTLATELDDQEAIAKLAGGV